MQKWMKPGIMILFCILFFGCNKHTPPVVDKAVVDSASTGYHRFNFDEYTPVDTKGYVQKVDNFTIVFDPSASMTETYTSSYDCIACHTDYQDKGYAAKHAERYGGKEFALVENQEFAMDCNQCHQNFLYTKFEFAKELAKGFNQAIPELDLIGTIRTFGSPAYVNFQYGLKQNDNKKYLKYDKKAFGRAIKKILDADGASPLASTLEAISRDWYDHKGRIAVIVISDGVGMGEKEVLAAEDLKAKYGEDICIYTVFIGNSPSGRKVMNRIALGGQCGIAIDGDQLLEKEKMEGFVTEIFLDRGQTDSDDDGDGVPNCCDDCPDTKPGVKVDHRGCWDLVVLADVLFDFDKYNLKPEGLIALEQVVEMLTKYPFLDLHISGHTDNFGSMEYNIKLSKRRATAGLDYLVKRGIDPKRLSISWHSYSIPVATNDTAAGRALNRRLEFKFSKPKK